jgi:hypothetical protein
MTTKIGRPKDPEDLVRVHIMIPRDLDEKVKQSAMNTDRSYSKMITHLLKSIYKR